MKRTLRKDWTLGTIWKAETPEFLITLALAEDRDFSTAHWEPELARETKAKLATGEWIVFESMLTVWHKGPNGARTEIAFENMCGSVYASGETWQFMRDGYFHDMLRDACRAARKKANAMPRLRAA